MDTIPKIENKHANIKHPILAPFTEQCIGERTPYTTLALLARVPKLTGSEPAIYVSGGAGQQYIMLARYHSPGKIRPYIGVHT